jgi:hypothetical protein
MNWQGALAYCEGLAWAKKADWRLPNANELMSLVDDRTHEPSMDTEVFPATPGGVFWSSSPSATKRSYAWYVDFSFGSLSPGLMEGGAQARCVRSQP